MLSHVILGTNDVDRAVDFYDQVLGVLGVQRRYRGATGAGYGLGDERGIDTFWLTKPRDGNPATVGNGTNVCFVAPTRAGIDAANGTITFNDKGGWHLDGIGSQGPTQGKFSYSGSYAFEKIANTTPQ